MVGASWKLLKPPPPFSKMATAAGRFRFSARVLRHGVLRSRPGCALGPFSKPRLRSYDYAIRHTISSAIHPPPVAESDAAAVAAAERGLRILRERSESLEQGMGERDATAKNLSGNLTTGSGSCREDFLFSYVQLAILRGGFKRSSFACAASTLRFGPP